MGIGSSISKEELDELASTTKFNRQELKCWYRRFKRDYPSGQLQKEQFYDLFSKISSSEQIKEDAVDHLFRLFDHDHDGSVSFSELMSTLSITNSGSVKEKIEWIFDIYDVDGDGYVTLDEMCDVVTCMQSVKKGRRRQRRIGRERLAAAFRAADADSDGLLTLDEFLEVTELLPELIAVLNSS